MVLFCANIMSAQPTIPIVPEGEVFYRIESSKSCKFVRLSHPERDDYLVYLEGVSATQYNAEGRNLGVTANLRIIFTDNLVGENSAVGKCSFLNSRADFKLLVTLNPGLRQEPLSKYTSRSGDAYTIGSVGNIASDIYPHIPSKVVKTIATRGGLAQLGIWIAEYYETATQTAIYAQKMADALCHYNRMFDEVTNCDTFYEGQRILFPAIATLRCIAYPETCSEVVNLLQDTAGPELLGCFKSLAQINPYLARFNPYYLLNLAKTFNAVSREVNAPAVSSRGCQTKVESYDEERGYTLVSGLPMIPIPDCYMMFYQTALERIEPIFNATLGCPFDNQ
jgi:hypothetical protein